MMNELYTGIAASLQTVRDCAVYQEALPQEPARPAFCTVVNGLSSRAGINGRTHHKVSFDIRYYPAGGAQEAGKECWETGLALSRDFQIPGFKMKNRNMKVEENVLHYFFDVECREIPDETSAVMKDIVRNESLKEE